MARFLLKRLGLAAITLFLLSVIVFVGSQVLPGNVARRILGPFADQAAVTDSFEAWLRRMPGGGTMVANAGDAGVETVLDHVAPDLSLVVAYALTDADPRRGGYLRGLADRFVAGGRSASSVPCSVSIGLPIRAVFWTFRAASLTDSGRECQS